MADVNPFEANYSSEQLEELRKAIRQKLNSAGALDVVGQLVSQLQRSTVGGPPLNPDQALQALKDQGVLEHLARSVTAPPDLVVKAVAPQRHPQASEALPSRVPPSAAPLLHVKLLGARALMDYVARPPEPGEQLKLCVELLGHRLDSHWVPAGAELEFAGELVVPLGPALAALPPPAPPGTKDQRRPGQLAERQDAAGADALRLLSVRSPMHIVLLSSMPQQAGEAQRPVVHLPSPAPWPDASYSSACSQVVAVGAGDWRTALLRSRAVTVSVQLASGPGVVLGVPAGSAPAGVAMLQLTLHPALPAPLDEGLLQVAQRTEALRDQQCATSFVQRAKCWWAEYVRKSSALRTRPIKVLARGEDGAQYPACSFVRPLQLGRLLATPRQAARFVSLLRQRDLDDAGVLPPGALHSTAAAAAAECWCCLHTVLSARAGTAEELAILLASLLLGYGLDAFVAVGRLRNGAGRMWVITRAAFAETTHWDPTTGERYTSLNGAACPFASVGSVFNHRQLFANCQPDDSALSCSYMFEEPYLWQALEVAPAEVPGPGWSSFPLRPDPGLLDVSQLEDQLEQGIKALLVVRRQEELRELVGSCSPPIDPDLLRAATMPPVWDVALEHLLTPALAAYEHEAVTGDPAAWADDFQTAIKRATPLGMVFKGVPQHHRHIDAGAIADALAADPQGMEVLCGVGEGSVLALRVRVTPYPEGVYSTWVLLACKCRNVPMPTVSDPHHVADHEPSTPTHTCTR